MKILLTITLLIFPILTQGQDNTLYVIASSGESQSSSNVSISWTLGGISLDAAQSNTVILTSGISQPNEQMIITSNDAGNYQLKVYPNPVMNSINIETAEIEVRSEYKLLNVDGSQILSGKIEGFLETIDFTNMTSGMYFLHFDDQTIIKIIKN